MLTTISVTKIAHKLQVHQKLKENNCLKYELVKNELYKSITIKYRKYANKVQILTM